MKSTLLRCTELFDSMEKVEECPQQGKAGQCTDIKIEECNETICNILIPLENYKDKVNPQAFTSLTLRQNETRQNYLVWPRQLNFKTSGCIEDKTYEYKYNLSHNETYWFHNCSVSAACYQIYRHI